MTLAVIFLDQEEKLFLIRINFIVRKALTTGALHLNIERFQ